MAAKIEQSLIIPIELPEEVKLFAIPGLGVDGRLYSRLRPFFPGIELIEWIEPEEKEPLLDYARRISHPILDWPGKAILIGTSFGGIVAQEIAQFLPLEGLVLLSTFKKGDGRPWYFPIGERLPVYQLFKGKWRYQMLPYWAPFVGITDKEEQLLLQDMFMNASTQHRLWGASQIVKWKGTQLNLPFVHIHGEKDHLFPSTDISSASFVKDTGHFMVAQKAEEVAYLISQWLRRDVYP